MSRAAKSARVERKTAGDGSAQQVRSGLDRFVSDDRWLKTKVGALPVTLLAEALGKLSIKDAARFVLQTAHAVPETQQATSDVVVLDHELRPLVAPTRDSLTTLGKWLAMYQGTARRLVLSDIVDWLDLHDIGELIHTSLPGLHTIEINTAVLCEREAPQPGLLGAMLPAEAKRLRGFFYRQHTRGRSRGGDCTPWVDVTPQLLTYLTPAIERFGFNTDAGLDAKQWRMLAVPLASAALSELELELGRDNEAFFTNDLPLLLQRALTRLRLAWKWTKLPAANTEPPISVDMGVVLRIIANVPRAASELIELQLHDLYHGWTQVDVAALSKLRALQTLAFDHRREPFDMPPGQTLEALKELRHVDVSRRLWPTAPTAWPLLETVRVHDADSIKRIADFAADRKTLRRVLTKTLWNEWTDVALSWFDPATHRDGRVPSVPWTEVQFHFLDEGERRRAANWRFFVDWLPLQAAHLKVLEFNARAPGVEAHADRSVFQAIAALPQLRQLVVIASTMACDAPTMVALASGCRRLECIELRAWDIDMPAAGFLEWVKRLPRLYRLYADSVHFLERTDPFVIALGDAVDVAEDQRGLLQVQIESDPSTGAHKSFFRSYMPAIFEQVQARRSPVLEDPTSRLARVVTTATPAFEPEERRSQWLMYP